MPRPPEPPHLRVVVPCALLVLSVLSVLFPAPAAAVSYSFGAYAKSFFAVQDPPAIQDAGFDHETPPLGIVTNRFRFNGRLKLSPRLRIDLSYDIVPQVQDREFAASQDFFPVPDASDYRVTDFDRRIYPREGGAVASFVLNQNLDRALITVRTDVADIYVGRQAIAFGSARIINPTDVLAPFTYETLDTEDRFGIDAVRVRVPLGALSELDVGYVPGDNFATAQSAQFVRTKFYLWQSDVTLMALGFRENLLLGVDFARDIGGAGIWFEGAYVFADALSGRARRDDDYLRLSAGADYNLTSTVYGFAEYHFNGAGNPRPRIDFNGASDVPYTEGAVYLLGEHYLSPGVVWQITPLITATSEMLWNLSDVSVLLVPSLEYNIRPNIDIGAGLYIGLGEGPRGLTTLRSEFGGYPDIGYTYVRIYF
jgi:hypothetical protein